MCFTHMISHAPPTFSPFAHEVEPARRSEAGVPREVATRDSCKIDSTSRVSRLEKSQWLNQSQGFPRNYHNSYSDTGKLQALVYDVLPSTTAVFSYALGS